MTVLILGIPYTKWGFKTDDFGNIYHSIIKSYKNLFKYFYEGNMESIVTYPSNSSIPPYSFFSGLYRPMSFIYFYIQYLLFGIKPYGYFLTTIIFHALNTIILFNLFTNITKIYISFLAASYFAFHPSLWNWIGWISAQTYFIELFVLLLSIIFLKKYLDTNKIIFYLFSCFLLLINLFLKEATILFPIWSVFAIFTYNNLQKKKTFLKNLNYSLLLSLGYWLISFFYLIIRALVFPITSYTGTFNCKPNLSSFIARIKNRLFDFVSYISEMFGLNGLPSNHQIIKGSILSFLIFIIIFLFIKNKRKTYIIFSIFSILIFSWPAILIQYQPRYIYMSIPFFILTILLLFKFYDGKFRFSKHIWLIFINFLIIYNAIFLITKLKHREKMLNKITTSFQKLSQNKIIRENIKSKKPICFLGLPNHWFGMSDAQAMWMLTKNSSYPVYIYGPNINLIHFYSYHEIPILEKNYLKISYIKNGFNFESLNSNKLWFLKKSQEKTDKIKILIEEKYLKEKPLFITWDYKNADFIILGYHKYNQDKKYE